MEKKQSVPHPAGNGGPLPQHSKPLIAYKQWKEGDGSVKMFYVKPFSHLNQMDIHSIPVTEVQVVVSENTPNWMGKLMLYTI